jgi:hypothetical protein
MNKTMKNITRKIILSITAFAVLLVIGCTEDFNDINTNPNQPDKASVPFLMTNAQFQLMDNYWDEWYNGRCGMLWSQYWSQNEYTEESRYRARPTTDNNYWYGFYAGMNDLQEIIRKSDNNNAIQIARILKSYFMQVLTDTYGYIPYSEALQGTDNLQPKFDSPQDIYNGLLSTLADAQSKLDPDQTQPVKGDNIYNGDVTKWKKFANSLRLRIATRMKDVASSAAQSAYDAAISAGVFESNADNATFVWGGSAPNYNPLHEQQLTRQDFSVSTTLMAYLKGEVSGYPEDPRKSIYASPITEGSSKYVGMPYGLTNSAAASMSNDEVSQPGWEVYRPQAPTILMTYDEVLFIKSEWNGFDANFYENAVRASMEFWGVSESDISSYLDRLPAPNPQHVYTQKWLALYMQGAQAWSHVRRTNTPDLDKPLGGMYSEDEMEEAGRDVPARRPYANNIYDLNKENLDKALKEQGPDNIATPIWWDTE